MEAGGGKIASVATFEFEVTGVFHISGRDGLVVTGMVLQGEVRPGAQLRDVATGKTFTLLSIDVAPARFTRGRPELGLLVSADAEDVAVVGRIWTASSD
jgi:hypothetical protein